MKPGTSQPWTRVALRLLLAALLVCPMPLGADSAQSGAASFSGQATVVRAMLLPTGTTIVLSDTKPLPPSGGAQEASLLNASVPGLLNAEVLGASTIGQGDRSRSEASVANLSLTIGGHSVSADFLTARAMAVCTPNGPTVSGSSEILGLVIDGQVVTVTGEPNQTILLPAGAGKVVINEQSSSVSGNTGDIMVNALHVIVNGVADITISSAHADITCVGRPPCTGGDFVTGGGWITTSAQARANFAVAGGIKNGAFWGHLEYVDHGSSGLKVHGTGVTAYVVTGPTSRHIEGTAEINGQSGFTYSADVSDNGEPGTLDTFAIMLSNRYSAANKLGGGNIQLHKPCQ